MRITRYISSKDHIHMNSTKWESLTALGKYLGREGICRIEEGDRGFEIAWIDNSPEALRRQNAIRKKERQDRGDEEREQKLIQEQVERAQREADEKLDQEADAAQKALQREDGEKIKLNLGSKLVASKQIPSPPTSSSEDEKPLLEDRLDASNDITVTPAAPATHSTAPIASEEMRRVGLSLGSSSKPRNVFAVPKKRNAFSGRRATTNAAALKPMNEAERIMKEEIERKRSRDNYAPNANSKRQKTMTSRGGT